MRLASAVVIGPALHVGDLVEWPLGRRGIVRRVGADYIVVAWHYSLFQVELCYLKYVSSGNYNKAGIVVEVGEN